MTPSARWSILHALPLTLSLSAVAAAATSAPPPTLAGPEERTSVSGLPQERDEPEESTLLSGKTDHGGYGAPDVKVSAVNGDPAAFVGIQGGWIVNHVFVLGIAGHGLATQHETPTALQVEGHSSTLQMGYGGFRLGYLFMPRSVLHAGVGLLIGGGGLAALSRQELPSNDGDGTSRKTAHAEGFFVAEPEIEGEVNVTRYLRIALSGSYRWIAGVEAPGLSGKKLSAPALGLALRFGSF